MKQISRTFDCRVVAILFLAAAWLSAENLHAAESVLAVGKLHVSTTELEAVEKAEAVSSLWQSLMAASLAQKPFLHVVERVDIDKAFHELELSKSFGRESAKEQYGAIQGTDYIVLGELHYGAEKCKVSYRLVNSSNSVVEAVMHAEFAADEVEKAVKKASREIELLLLRGLVRKSSNFFLSIVDFQNKSPLQRADWLETSIPDELERECRVLPQVYAVERNDLDLLLREERLRIGGFTNRKEDAAINANPGNRYLLIEGGIDESQPKGEPLWTHVTVMVTNLHTQQVRTVPMKFKATEVTAGLHALRQVLHECVARKPADEQSSEGSKPYYEAEVDALLANAFHLMGSDAFNLFRDRKRSAWRSFPTGSLFSESGHAGDESIARKAAIHRALRSLKRAVILNSDDPFIKSLISLLLVDPQVGDYNLARDLALEVAGRYADTEFQRDAWWFLVARAELSLEEMRHFVDLLIKRFPLTWQTQSAVSHFLYVFSYEYKSELCSDVDRDRIRQYVETAVKWGEDRVFVEAAVQSWFRLTQSSHVTGMGMTPEKEKALQSEGIAFIEELLKKYPERAEAICTYWAYQYFEHLKDWQKTTDWCRRGLACVPEDLTMQSDFDMRLYLPDHMRLMLGHSLTHLKQFDESLAVLREIVHPYHLKKAQELIAEIDEQDKDAFASAREKIIVRQAEWLQYKPKFPGSYVSDIEWDGQYVWVAVKHAASSRFANEHNLVMLEKDPKRLAEALKAGGLIRIDPVSRKTKTYTTGDPLSDSWITSVKNAAGRIWVGTYNAGIDVYDAEKQVWKNLSVPDGLPSNHVQCIDAGAGRLWIGFGRFESGAVASIDFETEQIRTFLPDNYADGDEPPLSYVTDVRFINGKLWCALNRKGAAMYDPATDRWHRYNRQKHGRNSSTLSRYFPDYMAAIGHTHDRVYFGAYGFSRTPASERGIAHCSLTGDDWRILSVKDGLPASTFFAFTEYADVLIMGTYGIVFETPEGEYVGYDLRKNGSTSLKVTALEVVNNELWVGTPHDLKIMRLPDQLFRKAEHE